MKLNKDLKQKMIAIELMKTEEIDELETLDTSFECNIDQNTNKICFKFDIFKDLPQNLFEKIVTNYYSNKFSTTNKKLCELILLKFNKPPVFTEETIFSELLKIFLKATNIAQKIQTNPVDFVSNFSFLYSNYKLTIEYRSISRRTILQNIEKDLIDFFALVNIRIDEFDYVQDNQWKEDVLNRLSNQKQKQITIHIDPNKEMLETAYVTNKNNIAQAKAKKMSIVQLEQYASELEFDDKFKTKIQGKIVRIGEQKTTIKAGKIYFNMTITDYESAVKFTVFVGIQENAWSANGSRDYLPLSYLKEFNIGDWVEVLVYCTKSNNIHNDLKCTLKAIIKIPTPNKYDFKDESPIKRVELMCHTKMTTCDSIMDINDIVNRVQKYGWKSFGITDRDSVQAFGQITTSKIAKVLSANNIKPIFGVELGLARRKVAEIKNPTNTRFDESEYVIFDIETTGLNSEYDEITEIGAVKLKDNIVIDRFDQLIKINGKLSDFISKKTHITNEMLADKPPLKEVLKQFKEFIGDKVIVAHNGFNFDMRFLNKKLSSCGLGTINNTCIDTLFISRLINKEYKKHTLEYIAGQNNITYSADVAHRADFDCEVLAKVWINMIEKLKSLKLLTFIDYNNSPMVQKYADQTFPPIVVIYAKNQAGIKKLYQLVSAALTTNLVTKPVIYLDQIEKYRDDLIIVSHPTEGEVFDICINGTDEQLIQAINWYDYVFVCPPGCMNLQIKRGEITKLQYEQTVKKIIDVSIKCNKSVIAVSDAYFMDECDQEAYKIMINHRAIKKVPHRLYSFNKTNIYAPDLHLRNTTSMIKEFEFLKDDELVNKIVIENSNKFSDTIDLIQPLKLKPHPPFIENVDDKLKECVISNAKKTYGEQLPEVVLNRINDEIKLIVNHGYSVIYWICHMLVSYMNKSGCSVGSRGSVGSSLVAFLARISEVNPLIPHYYCKKCQYSNFDIDTKYADGFDLPLAKCPKCGELLTGDGHNIPFETFLGLPTKPKTPDIDLNFSGSYQSLAHNFIRNEFGKDHTFRVGTITTQQVKTAYGEVRSYFEKNFPSTPVTDAKIDWLSTYLEGCKTTTGQHPGGIVIVPKQYDVEDFTPINYPAGEKDANNVEDWKTTHFDFDSMHETLLKFDILGQDMPTMLEFLSNATKIDLTTIPFDDEQVMSLFSSIDALKLDYEDLLDDSPVGILGVSEYGTPATMRILKVCKPKTFADLVKISGLSHGKGLWKGNAEDIINSQQKTIKDVIGCREDIINQLVSIWNVDKNLAFTISEVLRKGGAFDVAWEQILHSENHKVPDWYINSCKKITYLFPKAHAVAYALMPWRMAWFKLHYPKEFYAGYFTVFAKEFDLISMTQGPRQIREKIKQLIEAIKLMQKQNETISKIQKAIDTESCLRIALECWLRGIEIKMIDLNKSKAREFYIEKNSIYLPFITINGLGTEVADSIIKARNEKFFKSREDLKQRTKINKNHFEILLNNHVLDGLPETSQISLF